MRKALHASVSFSLAGASMQAVLPSGKLFWKGSLFTDDGARRRLSGTNMVGDGVRVSERCQVVEKGWKRIAALDGVMKSKARGSVDRNGSHPIDA